MNEPDLSSLRAWQSEAIRQYIDNGYPKNYTVTATPGAGKTNFALTLAKFLFAKKMIDRVVIIVPTDHLRTQWALAASKMGIMLDPTLGNNAVLKKEYHGYVSTYPQVAQNPLLHQRRTERPKQTLVILDEVHHAGDGLSWGDGIRFAFEDASRRLALTGTPFRTSPAEKIPFVSYEDDGEFLKSTADYTYGYGEALADGVVRPVMFAAYTGVARWVDNAGEAVASIGDEETKDKEASAWKTILKPDGKWIPHVLSAAVARLEEIRNSGMPDAGLLVLASDQESAKAYAKVIKSLTGVSPTVALSEDPKASKKITEFNNGNTKYLVAVRMVSEGVDVPRLAVLVWLTSYRTPLFFAQAVGRVVRSRKPNEQATVFLPSVKALLTLAADMENQRTHNVFKALQGEEKDLEVLIDKEENEPGLQELNEYKAIDSQAQFAHVLYGGKAITGRRDRLALSSEETEFLGLLATPGMLSPEQTAELLASRDLTYKKKSSDLVSNELGEEAANMPIKVASISPEQLHIKLMDLRKEITMMVNKLAVRMGRSHADIHILTRKTVPGPSNAEADLDVLTRRRDWLLGRLEH
jgi:superfamily II DNA or RNA helicase